MPGFTVPPFDAESGSSTTIGSFAYSVQTTNDYFLSYTWLIDEVVGTSVNNTPLVHLQNVKLPTFSATATTVPGASLNYKFAEVIEWNPVSVSWYDTEGLLDIIKKWRTQVWSDDSGLQSAGEYKKNTAIISYTPDGNYLNRYKLIGSWPSTINYGELTYSGNSAVKLVEVVLTYDWAEEQSSYDGRFDSN